MTMIRMKLNQARNIQRISIIELVSCSDKGTVFFSTNMGWDRRTFRVGLLILISSQLQWICPSPSHSACLTIKH